MELLLASACTTLHCAGPAECSRRCTATPGCRIFDRGKRKHVQNSCRLFSRPCHHIHGQKSLFSNIPCIRNRPQNFSGVSFWNAIQSNFKYHFVSVQSSPRQPILPALKPSPSALIWSQVHENWEDEDAAITSLRSCGPSFEGDDRQRAELRKLLHANQFPPPHTCASRRLALW